MLDGILNDYRYALHLFWRGVYHASRRLAVYAHQRAARLDRGLE